MKFLVDILPKFPHDLPVDTLADLVRRETDAAVALMEQGVLLQIHRVAGRGGNVSIWETATVEELDRVLNALPMAPFLSFTVTPLMQHRVEKAFAERQAK